VWLSRWGLAVGMLGWGRKAHGEWVWSGEEYSRTAGFRGGRPDGPYEERDGPVVTTGHYRDGERSGWWEKKKGGDVVESVHHTPPRR
jgi:hypothetical protein